MDRQRLLDARSWAVEELRRCLDFWLAHGMDRVHGGVYTCLDRRGEIYSTDKSVWMQGRCGWTFSYMCARYGARREWLEAAESCLDFMERYCVNHAAGDRMYFTVTEDGRPLRQRRYYFSESFYAMANAEYYGVTGRREHLERARRAYEAYWTLYRGGEDPTGLGPKTEPSTRTGRAFGPPMIFLNLSGILRRVDPERSELYDARAEICVEEIFRYHVRPELRCTLENVSTEGEPRLYYTEGRTVNPGHDIEAVWFLLEQARRTGDRDLVWRAAQMFDWAVEGGWDREYGGIKYFIDCKGLPQEAYEHDMKLWWPHNELLISSLMLYRDTGEEKYLDWFYRGLDYCRAHFSDPEYGEWYGYLRRDGKPTEPPTKGSTFKGPFHLPRSLSLVTQTIDELLS